MVELTEEMVKLLSYTYDDRFSEDIPVKVVHLATADKDGKPNVVPISFIKVIDKDKVAIANMTLDKTLKNIQENPKVSIGALDLLKVEENSLKVRIWPEVLGYQFKGTAKIVESSPEVEVLQEIVSKRVPIPVHGAIIVTIEEIYKTS